MTRNINIFTKKQVKEIGIEISRTNRAIEKLVHIKRVNKSFMQSLLEE